MKPPLSWNFLFGCMHSAIILFVKNSVLNFWQFSEYICLDNCSVICTLTLCYVLHQRHSEFWHIQNHLFRYMQAYPGMFSIIKAYVRPHNIPVTLDLVKEVIIDLDSSKVVWPGCIPVVALKNCEAELLYVLAHCNQGPGKFWKALEFDKYPGLLINFKKCLRLSWNSYMRKSIFDHLLSFSKYFIMIGFQLVSIIMLVLLSIYLRKIMSNQMFKRKWINLKNHLITQSNYKKKKKRKRKNRFSVSESGYRFFFLSLLT